MNATETKGAVNTGIPRLDRILGGMFIGDNVVWYDESGNLAQVFWHHFVQASLAEKKAVIFASFDRSPKNLFERLGPLGKNPLLTVLDCFTHGKGNGIGTFQKFLEEAPPEIRNRVERVENPRNPAEFSERLYALQGRLSGQVHLVFESLTGMQELWGGEDEVGRFYSHSCPRLYDLNTVAYWVAEKGAHSRRLRSQINQIAQVALELSIKRGTSTVSVIKAEGREPLAVQEPQRYQTRGSEVFFAGEKDVFDHDQLGGRIKKLRVRRGFSQAELAKRVGVTASTISQVESNTIYPSIPGLLKMAEVLSVDVGHFFSPGRDKRLPVIFPASAAQGVRLANMKDETGARLLTPVDFPEKTEAYLIEISPGQDISGHFLSHKGSEMGFMVAGTLRMVFSDSVHTADAGDLIYLSDQIPVQWENPGPGTARLFWIKLPISAGR